MTIRQACAVAHQTHGGDNTPCIAMCEGGPESTLIHIEKSKKSGGFQPNISLLKTSKVEKVEQIVSWCFRLHDICKKIYEGQRTFWLFCKIKVPSDRYANIGKIT